MTLAPLRIRRDGLDHVIADPPMTRAEAVQWLWEGRVMPPESRFRPDPLQGQADDPQSRFLFNITPDEFVEARQDFKDRYLADGPGITLERALPAWLPANVCADIINQEEQGSFRRRLLPRTLTYPGAAPWDRIVVWAGLDEFRRPIFEIFNYFPNGIDFYKDLAGSNTQRARLFHHAYTSWNNDMHYFVEERQMRPTTAREEILRINTAIFRTLLEAVATIFAGGSPVEATNSMSRQANDTLQAVLDSYRAGRRAFSLAERQALPKMAIWRGTTLRWRRGGSGPADLHDLHLGCYFTSDPAVASVYAQMRGTVDDPAIILRTEVAVQDLGRVLDLVGGPYAQRWDELVQGAGPSIANERYHRLFMGFLQTIGRDLDDFDTIIGREYLRGGVQINIRTGSVLDNILQTATEILR